MPPAAISRNELISEIWNCFYNTDSDELLYIYKERSIVLGKEVTFQLDGKLKKGLAKKSQNPANFKSNLKINILSG